MRLVFLSAQQRRINCEEVDSGGLGMTFEFNKRAELFVGTHDKAPSIVTVCVCDPGQSAASIWTLVRFGSVVTSFAAEPFALAFPQRFKVFCAKPC